MAKNVVLISGGPGLYHDKDVEHDRSWANYVTPPLLKTKADLIGSSKRDVLWIIHRPSYDARWTDDEANGRSSFKEVKGKGFSSYRDLLEGRAAKKGWRLHWASDADEVWKALKRLKQTIDRLWYWGHARDELWLTIDHDAAGTAIAPASSAILSAADIPKALKVSTGGPPPRHRFVGCNTKAFASEWAKVFGACTEGVDQKIDFGGIHKSGGDPDLVGTATIEVFCGSSSSSGTTWAYLPPDEGEDRQMLLAESDAEAHDPLDAMAAAFAPGPLSITVDPGHGGEMSAGTSTPFGVRAGVHQEKTITLALGRALAARLGAGTRLTREEDVNPTLAARIGGAKGSSIFVSLHANGGAPSDRGPQTWVHADAGAESVQLATCIQRALAGLIGHDRGVARGELAVLSPAHHAAGTAACLVEAEYLTHPEGARWLTDSAARDRVADAIARGVREYGGVAEPSSLGSMSHGAHELYGGHRPGRYGSGVIAFGHLARAMSAVTFPSGESLDRVSLPTGPKDEHYDPKASGNPLLDTGEAVRSKRLSEHFTVGELARSGKRRFDVARIDPRLVSCLEALRVHVGVPVKITSGYRSWAYNVSLYEARGKKPTRSEHCAGRAADVSIEGLTGLQIAQAVIESYGCEVGLGLAPTFAHVDVRGVFTTWQYASRGYPKAQADADLAELRSFHRARCLAPAGASSLELGDDETSYEARDEETEVELESEA